MSFFTAIQYYKDKPNHIGNDPGQQRGYMVLQIRMIKYFKMRGYFNHLACKKFKSRTRILLLLAVLHG